MAESVPSPLLSAAGWSRVLQDADAAIRAPLALSRSIGVMSAEPGSGTTTIAAALFGMLTRRRPGAVLGVDAGGGNLAGRVGSAARDGGQKSVDGAIDLTRPGETWASPVGRWRADVAPTARLYDLVVTDWGARPWASDFTDTASMGHVAIVVTRASRRAALEAAAPLTLLPPTVRPILVVVDVERRGDGLRSRLQKVLEVPVLALKYDGALGRLESGGRSQAGARARRELIAIGAAAVQQAVLTTRPPPSERSALHLPA